MECAVKTSFKSMTLIGAALASAMVCYTISLKVSAERAAVERTRGKIAVDLADIRLLQAELRTRARLPELQRWNEQVLALTPPKAEQFLGNPVMLASFAVEPARPAAPAVQLAAVIRAPTAVPMAAPSPVRQVAYSVPVPSAVVAEASPPSRVAVAAVTRSRPAEVAQRSTDLGLDSALAASIDAAAAAERSGFQKIALR